MTFLELLGQISSYMSDLRLQTDPHVSKKTPESEFKEAFVWSHGDKITNLVIFPALVKGSEPGED